MHAANPRPNQERPLIPLPFPEGKEVSRRLEDWSDDTTDLDCYFWRPVACEVVDLIVDVNRKMAQERV